MSICKESSPTFESDVISAMVSIASLVTRELSISDIYLDIHHIVSKIIELKNIAIFRVDMDQKQLILDYFVDEKDKIEFNGQIIPMGKGVSSYCIRQQKPCLLSENDILKLQSEQEIDTLYGTMPHSWMGVPVMHETEVLGLIIVQSYSESTEYTRRDLEVLTFIAANISIVLKQKEISDREKETNQALKSSLETITIQNKDIENKVEQLKNTQKELIQKEKMASLGSLVAGIAHEINTPLGICVTGISNLDYHYKQFDLAMENGTATDTQLQNFLEDVGDMCKIISTNVQRAATLIQGFKQIAVDQSSESMRTINLVEYINEVIHSLNPMIKKTSHSVQIDGDKTLNVFTKPGAISQLITNLVNNAFLHGFEGKSNGVVQIKVFNQNSNIHLEVSDNGVGMNREQLANIYEPFYTTKRGLGGSGLGAHIIFNIATSILGGKIDVSSVEEQGTKFLIIFPKLDENSNS